MSNRTFHTTPELQVGDLVLTHGMRVRLDTPPNIYPGQGEPDRLDVYAWDGKIENLDEVLAEGVVPRSWVSAGRWVIQGNARAQWYVEPSSSATPAEGTVRTYAKCTGCGREIERDYTEAWRHLGTGRTLC